MSKFYAFLWESGSWLLLMGCTLRSHLCSVFFLQFFTEVPTRNFLSVRSVVLLLHKYAEECLEMAGYSSPQL